MPHPPALLPNNRLPKSYTYDAIAETMREWQIWRIKIGNNTYASMSPLESEIKIIHHWSEIVWLAQNGKVALNTCGIFRPTVADRMTRAVSQFGYRVELTTTGKRKYVLIDDHTDTPVASFTHFLSVPPSLND